MSESARLEDLVLQYEHQLYGWSRLWTVDSDNVWLKRKQSRLRVEAVQISFNGRGAWPYPEKLPYRAAAKWRVDVATCNLTVHLIFAHRHHALPCDDDLEELCCM
jgi:hypothetical protein